MPGVLGLIVAGALIVALTPFRARWVGVAPCLVALALWAQTERPALLVSGSGGLLGVLTPEGRSLSKERGDGFSARSWLENDGDGVAQDVAYGRDGILHGKGRVDVDLGAYRVTQLRGKTGAAQFADGILA